MEIYEESAAIYRALSHPVRLKILDLLRHGSLCVCHLEEILDKRQAYVSQQLSVLREAGLVENERVGVQAYYRICHPNLQALLAPLLGEEPRPLPELMAVCNPNLAIPKFDIELEIVR